MNTLKYSFSAGLGALCLAGSAFAQTLMLDFGPTTAVDDAGDDNSLLNSPYHTANESFAGSVWNTVNTTDIAAGGLAWSDGTTAGSLVLDLGQTTNATGRTLLLGSTPTQNVLGNASNTDVYAGTSVGKDGIFPTSTGTRAVGFQLTGLATGTYDVYVTARNTNQNSAHYQTVYAGVTAAAGDFDFSGYNSGALSYTSGSVAIAEWVENENYVKFSVSITAGEALNIASIGGQGGSGDRGFLNSVQIVSTTAIPEPSAFAALAGLGALALVATRRRGRR